MPKPFDSAERRAEIADVVIRLLVSEGVGGVSLRSVAAEAGLALGSVRYVFPTRADLLAGAADVLFEQSRSRAIEMIHGDDPREVARLIADLMLHVDDEEHPQVDLYLALITESRTTPALRRARDKYRTGMRQAAEYIVMSLSPEGLDLDEDLQPSRRPTDAERLEAARLQALIEGLGVALHHVDDGPDAPTAAAHQKVARECRAVLADTLERLAAGRLAPGRD